MIRLVYKDCAGQHRQLFDKMYRDREVQFSQRLGWSVHVDEDGRELDEYDSLNPLYLILEGLKGTHEASMRFLPTTGDTMINDHFTELAGGVTVKSPRIWECTRFCLSPEANSTASAKLLLATVELGLQFNLQFFIGVFDQRMTRVYKRIGWSPVIIGKGTTSASSEICAGLWPISEAVRNDILVRQGMPLRQRKERSVESSAESFVDTGRAAWRMSV